MKNTGTVLGIISLIAVGVLYILHFSGDGKAIPMVAHSSSDSSTASRGMIAFFVMDSIESKYEYIKHAREELKREEEKISNELNGLRNKYMTRIQELKQKEKTMSMEEGYAAQNEIDQMQNNMMQREKTLSESLGNKQAKMLKEINETIEGFLIDYNKNKQYAYIISHQQGDMIFYRDSMLNITDDVVTGLNKLYGDKKPAK